MIRFNPVKKTPHLNLLLKEKTLIPYNCNYPIVGITPLSLRRGVGGEVIDTILFHIIFTPFLREKDAAFCLLPSFIF